MVAHPRLVLLFLCFFSLLTPLLAPHTLATPLLVATHTHYQVIFFGIAFLLFGGLKYEAMAKRKRYLEEHPEERPPPGPPGKGKRMVLLVKTKVSHLRHGKPKPPSLGHFRKSITPAGEGKAFGCVAVDANLALEHEAMHAAEV